MTNKTCLQITSGKEKGEVVMYINHSVMFDLQTNLAALFLGVAPSNSQTLAKHK